MPFAEQQAREIWNCAKFGGRSSHFNIDAPLEQVLFNLMGVGATIIVTGSVLTLVIGGYLGSQASHWIGGDLTDATGMPLTGWSTTGGDFRPAHFHATHMMQVMPVVGLLADRSRAPTSVAGFATLLYVAAIGWAVAQALMGMPLLAW